LTNEINNIINNCLRKDINAQRALYDLYVDRLYYVVYRYVSDPYYIENILQDVFLKALNKLDTFDSNKASFSTWINTIAIRESLNHLRKKKLIFIPFEESTKDISADIDPLIAKMEAQELMYLIASIPEKLRIVFNLYEVDGYSHKEIENMLDITASTSRAYLTRAKKHIQSIISLNVS